METLFGLLTVLPLPWWVSMLLFPRSRATRTLVLTPWPFLVGAILQGMLLLAALSAGQATLDLALGPLAAAFTGGWAFLALWTHLNVANLFMGVWIFRDARYYGRLPRAELLLTWFLGPLGLGVYLWRRRAWAASDPVRIVN